jgi:CubicO group peptidase (beta-lactamase class C family)
MTVPGGAGALRTSADDLARWTPALLSGHVLGLAATAQMTTPGRLSDGRLSGQNRVATPATEPHTEYGFGLRIGAVDGHPEIGHEGDILGFNAAVDTYPDQGTTIVVLANTPAGAYALEKDIARLVLAAAPPRPTRR